MRDIQELLAEKETELERVQKEVEVLRAVIPLLADDIQEPGPDDNPVSSSQATGTDGPSSSGANSKLRFWSVGRRWNK
jgi:hypothetical protein